MELANLFRILRGLPKSIYVNFRQLPVRQAIRLPILVSSRTKFKSLKGRIVIDVPVHCGMIRVGLSGSGTAMFTPTVIENYGTIVVKGNVIFGGGCQLCTVRADSLLEIGSQTSFSGECHLIAAKRVSIGDDCAISWDTQIMDSDLHKILSDGEQLNEDAEIIIGNHVWITSRVTIYKGSRIPDGCIVASNSVIKGVFEKPDCIITGLPHREIRKDITWHL